MTAFLMPLVMLKHNLRAKHGRLGDSLLAEALVGLPLLGQQGPEQLDDLADVVAGRPGTVVRRGIVSRRVVSGVLAGRRRVPSDKNIPRRQVVQSCPALSFIPDHPVTNDRAVAGELDDVATISPLLMSTLTLILSMIAGPR